MTTEERAFRMLARWLKNNEPDATLRALRYFQGLPSFGPAIRVIERIEAAPLDEAYPFTIDRKSIKHSGGD